MRLLQGPTPIAATVTLVWLVANGSIVNAQQRGTTTGIGAGGTTGAGAASTTAGSTRSTASSGVLGGGSIAGGQGGGLSGQGVQAPQFRAFGEMQNQSAFGSFGGGAADAFAGQQVGGRQNSGFGTGPQLGGLGGAFFGGQGGGRGSTTPGTGQASTRSRAEQLRPRHRVAFPFSPVPNARVSANLRVHLRPLQGRIRAAQFSLAGDGTLTLQGTAASINDRELAEAVARLEPGVRRIDNQIVVPQSPNSPTQAPGGP